jgi:RNA polymerase subunit RPABC4/transcription elongation factor Spt4
LDSNGLDNFFNTISNIIHSPYWMLALYVILFLVGVLWLSLIFWTVKDARKRIDDKLIVAVAVLTSLILPFVGTLVYAILRPAEFLADVRERELEMRAMELELQSTRACPTCGEPVRPDYLVCPSCRRALRTSCATCGKVLEPSWKICPFCAQETRVRRVPLPADMEQPTELYEGQVSAEVRPGA